MVKKAETQNLEERIEMIDRAPENLLNPEVKVLLKDLMKRADDEGITPKQLMNRELNEFFKMIDHKKAKVIKFNKSFYKEITDATKLKQILLNELESDKANYLSDKYMTTSFLEIGRNSGITYNALEENLFLNDQEAKERIKSIKKELESNLKHFKVKHASQLNDIVCDYCSYTIVYWNQDPKFKQYLHELVDENPNLIFRVYVLK